MENGFSLHRGNIVSKKDDARTKKNKSSVPLCFFGCVCVVLTKKLRYTKAACDKSIHTKRLNPAR